MSRKSSQAAEQEVTDIIAGAKAVFDDVTILKSVISNVHLVGAVDAPKRMSRLPRIRSSTSETGVDVSSPLVLGLAAIADASDRGYAPYQGGTNVYTVSDVLDLNPRQAQHPLRRSLPRQRDEH